MFFVKTEVRAAFQLRNKHAFGVLMLKKQGFGRFSVDREFLAEFSIQKTEYIPQI